MGAAVILATLTIDWSWWLAILKAAAGLGFVIFVHELGHFAVAKWCGVRCDKFYLGFDIYGLKLFKFKWGETEYGIGALPLGGYVKMLGQDDNPASQAEEIEKARTGQAPPLDPRSYLAKSVPQRMAIISAGVTMNLIFAFIFSVIAYNIGVKYVPCVIDNVSPGDPAWLADVRPGDEAVSISGIEKPRFDQDLMGRVTLANLEHGVTMVMKRPGEPETAKVITPRQNPLLKRPTIGISMPRSLVVGVPKDGLKLEDPFSKAEPAFVHNDKIIKVNNTPVTTQAEFDAVLEKHVGETLSLVVERSKNEPKADGSSATEQVTIKVPPHSAKLLGLVMEINPIAAVQENSPAFRAGLKADDRLESINGEPIGNPLYLPERFNLLAGKPVKLGIQRAKESLTIELTPRAATWQELPLQPRGLLGVPALGIAVGISNRVAAVEPGSPAEKAGIKPGTIMKSVTMKFDSAHAAVAKELKLDDLKYSFQDDEKDRVDWAYFHLTALPSLFDGTELTFTTSELEKFALVPVNDPQHFVVDRGIPFMLEMRTRKAESFGEALALGWRETKEDVLLVYRFLQKLVSGQISPTMLRGPLTIGYVAHDRASAGFPQLLIFLAVLSANLAVVNFLPIPVLDGGHIVFLALEGIRGKPVNESVVVAFHYAGLALILSLMVFVLSMDVGDFWGR